MPVFTFCQFDIAYNTRVIGVYLYDDRVYTHHYTDVRDGLIHVLYWIMDNAPGLEQVKGLVNQGDYASYADYIHAVNQYFGFPDTAYEETDTDAYEVGRSSAIDAIVDRELNRVGCTDV